ncbi:MAG: hypothetical protein Fur002_22260 [Anaerolineales bacterium]
MIVESQPLMLSALSAALIADEVSVVGEVNNSWRVFQTAQKTQPRLILFSVGNPSLPDLERISALRHEFPHLLILALVSGDFRGQERMALDYGAHRVLSKAAPRTELIAAVKDLARSNCAPFKKEAT